MRAPSLEMTRNELHDGSAQSFGVPGWATPIAGDRDVSSPRRCPQLSIDGLKSTPEPTPLNGPSDCIVKPVSSLDNSGAQRAQSILRLVNAACDSLGIEFPCLRDIAASAAASAEDSPYREIPMPTGSPGHTSPPARTAPAYYRSRRRARARSAPRVILPWSSSRRACSIRRAASRPPGASGAAAFGHSGRIDSCCSSSWCANTFLRQQFLLVRASRQLLLELLVAGTFLRQQFLLVRASRQLLLELLVAGTFLRQQFLLVRASRQLLLELLVAGTFLGQQFLLVRASRQLLLELLVAGTFLRQQFLLVRASRQLLLERLSCGHVPGPAISARPREPPAAARAPGCGHVPAPAISARPREPPAAARAPGCGHVPAPAISARPREPPAAARAPGCGHVPAPAISARPREPPAAARAPGCGHVPGPAISARPREPPAAARAPGCGHVPAPAISARPREPPAAARAPGCGHVPGPAISARPREPPAAARAPGCGHVPAPAISAHPGEPPAAARAPGCGHVPAPAISARPREPPAAARALGCGHVPAPSASGHSGEFDSCCSSAWVRARSWAKSPSAAAATAAFRSASSARAFSSTASRASASVSASSRPVSRCICATTPRYASWAMSIARPIGLNTPPDIRENIPAVCPACAGELLALSAVPTPARRSRPSSARPNTISATQHSSSASRAAPARGSGERTTCGFSFMNDVASGTFPLAEYNAGECPISGSLFLSLRLA